MVEFVIIAIVVTFVVMLVVSLTKSGKATNYLVRNQQIAQAILALHIKYRKNPDEKRFGKTNMHWHIEDFKDCWGYGGSLNSAFFERKFRDFDPFAGDDYYDKYSEENAQQFVALMQEYQANTQGFIRNYEPSGANSAAGKARDQALANSGTPFAAQAQKNLDAAQAKQAQKEIVKAAVVGGIIAGETGAVVGAVAAKAKIDAQSATKDAKE